MTIRDSYPEPDVEDQGVGVLRRRCVPLFTVLIGLLATMNIASVIFVLLE
ncbi:hypothetical protein [Microvirga arabica]|uniref:Uncharacterized protein n=1 Tax=Microvirga arabica TaxID=1128671 RepID=A0ABV6Y2D7_9HYPH|nr:hypothetical protein [Microvirga arabica]MBM1170741.1 hypothetical protein [Microvirga arabica]